MARGTDFGGIHSALDLNLIQQSVEVQPAEPKLNLIDIPGADGTKDLSELPSGRVVFNDRTITWTFALYPGDNWPEKQRQVSNALNGKRCHITLDDSPDFYLDGRLAVKSYNRDKTLRQITLEATCGPYLLRHEKTRVEAALISTYQQLRIINDRKPAVPTITVSTATTLQWQGSTIVLNAGTHTVLDIEFQEGDNLLEAKTNGGTGTITIEYQEGSL